MVSDRRALLRSARVRGVKLPVALLDATSPPVSGNRNADMVRANARAGRRDFLLGLAGCEGKNLIAEARRRAFAGGWFSGRGPTAPALSRWSGGLCYCGARFG